MKSKFLPVFIIAKNNLRQLFRDKVAIFFTILFPLIFLFVFGGFFGKGNNVNFKVAIINESSSEFAKNFESVIKDEKIFKVQPVSGLEDAKTKLNRSEVDSVIVLPSSFGQVKDDKPSGEAKILYTEANASAAQALKPAIEASFKEINNKISPSTTPFTVTTQSTATEGLTQFDYIFAGLLGFAIMSLGIFGPINVYPKLKQTGVLRRFQSTPIRVWQYFVGNVLSNSITGLVSVTTMFIVALSFFHLKMRGDYLSLIVLVILSTAVLFGIGLAVGGWAKNESQAAPLGNIVAFPMMFLSGSFFPRFLMPQWLQDVTQYIPLTPVIDGARMIITEGKTLFDIMPQVGLIALWGVVVYLIAFRVFRWE